MTTKRREALQLAKGLYDVLLVLHERDQEQELDEEALRPLDACWALLRDELDDGDPILESIRDVISPEAIEAGKPIRVVNALFVVGLLKTRLAPTHNASIQSSALLTSPYRF